MIYDNYSDQGKLHNYINTADDKQIKSIYDLFEDQLAPPADWSEDKEFVAELDERVRRWREGIDKGYTWEETKAEIDARRKKRYPNS